MDKFIIVEHIELDQADKYEILYPNTFWILI